MFSKDFLPSEFLRGYVKLIRLRHFTVKPNMPLACKPFPPRPEQCLIFYPRGFEVVENVQTGVKTVRTGSVVSGQFTHRVNRYLGSTEFLMIEVDLLPGALHRLIGLPFKELRNQDVDAELLFSPALRRVNERLRSSESYTEMLSIIETFLHDLLQKDPKPLLQLDKVIEVVACQFDSISIDALAKKSYLSPRQLERKFDERIGVGPKTFLKLCRFNLSYWMHLSDPSQSWSNIAYACGYSDYQHLVKDYLEFSSTTPTRFFSEERKAPGRVLGLTK
jgi:AraC-like DNA-binding protein